MSAFAVTAVAAAAAAAAYTIAIARQVQHLCIALLWDVSNIDSKQLPAKVVCDSCRLSGLTRESGLWLNIKVETKLQGK